MTIIMMEANSDVIVIMFIISYEYNSKVLMSDKEAVITQMLGKQQ